MVWFYKYNQREFPEGNRKALSLEYLPKIFITTSDTGATIKILNTSLAIVFNNMEITNLSRHQEITLDGPITCQNEDNVITGQSRQYRHEFTFKTDKTIKLKTNIQKITSLEDDPKIILSNKSVIINLKTGEEVCFMLDNIDYQNEAFLLKVI